VNDELVGSVTDANELQLLNAKAPILVTELGIVIDVNAIHPLNALSPILVTVFPIVTPIKLVGYGT
jgi:hypothetical protein